ncbi:MAG: hypothetical protein FJW95_14475 [Actinobacteria bacterium]|nr:hypothetical protein [Actinomycetota bacterium]
MARSPSPRPRLAVRLGAVAASAALATLAVGVGALPVAAATKPPVSIPGKVTNEGVGKVKGGAVAVDADDFSFDKTYLKSGAGSVSVTVSNTGTAPHTFTVAGQDIDVELSAGAEKTVTVAVSGGDPVVFYCRFHRGSGMQGAFFTKKGAAAAGTRTDSGGGSYGY